MVALKCKMCGGDLTPIEGSTVCECEFCGTLQTIPNADNEKKMNLFTRANRLRFNNEFDKAAGVYEAIISEFQEEAEAYWGLVLCKYGIEYVDDPLTGKKVPTCHRSSFESIFDDNNYEMVMEYADAVAKRVYRDEAKKIEDLRKGIIEVSSNEQPYDIFICYKETDENGERTLDSVLAQDIYNALTEKGYRVFFSRITLEDKLGTEYEPYIFAALHSAKLMLAVGTKFEYFDAVWVKNEWSRYLHLIASGEKKTMIPVYKNLDAYDMPKEFARLQAQDMGKVGAMQDLLRGIDKILRKDNKEKEEKNTDSGLSVLNAQTQSLLKRGNMAIEDGDFTRANEFYEQVLNNDAECGAAYWGKVLCVYNSNCSAELAKKLFDQIKKHAQEHLWVQTLPFEAHAYAREADSRHFLDEFSDQELDKLLIGLHPEKITFTLEDPVCYREAFRNLSVEGLGKLLNNRDYKRACRYKDGNVEKEINKVIDKLRDLLKSEMSKELEKRKNAEKLLAEQSELFKRDISDRLEKNADQISKIKIEEETARKKAEKDAEDSYQRDISQWENDNNLAVKKWEQSKIDYEESCITAEKKKGELEEKIKKLESEKKNLKGLFSGKKRKELEDNIAALKKTLIETKPVTKPADKPVQKPKPEKKAVIIHQNNTVSAKAMIINAINPLINKAQIISQGFGTYQYDSQKKPIKWRILEVKKDRALLITEDGIDAKPYNEEYESITWEKCSIRKWLNKEFYNTVFNGQEKARILTTKVTADKNPEYPADPGKNTQDKIFLLSVPEVNKYFKSDENRSAKATPYAKKNGAYTNDKGMCSWWLRSPGSDSGFAAKISVLVDVIGDSVDDDSNTVRPALWVKID